jgi:hypothetical protein
MTDIFTEDVITSFTNCETCNQNKQSQNLKTEHVVVRCMRKKYKCIMLWLLSIIVVTQFLLKQFDDNFISSFTEQITKFMKPTRVNNSDVNK